MRADEQWHVVLFRGGEQLTDVFNRVVVGDVLTHDTPCHALGAQEIVLWIGDDDSHAVFAKLHTGSRNSGVRLSATAIDDGLLIVTCVRHD